MTKYGLIIGKEYSGKDFFLAILGEEPKRGKNPRARQTKLLDERVKWEQVGKGKGTKYILHEVYEDIQIKLRGKYADNMKTALIYELQNNVRNELVVPKSILMREIGMVHDNYINYINKSITGTHEKFKIHPAHLLMFKNNVNDLFGNTLKRNIDTLNNKKYIIYNSNYRVKFTLKSIELDGNGDEKYDEDGKLIYTEEPRYMLLNQEQNLYVTDAHRQVLDLYGYVNMQEVYKNGKHIEFYKKVNELIKHKMQSDYEDMIPYRKEYSYIVKFEYCYEVYEIRSVPSIVKNKIPKKDYETAIKNMNDICKETLIKSINNPDTLDKKQERMNQLKYNEPNIGIEEYLKDVPMMIDIFIDIDKNSVKEVKNIA